MKYPLKIRGKNLLSIAVIFIVSIAIVGAAIWSMVILMVPAGQAYENNPAPAIWLDPSFIDNLNVSNSFTVSIVVNITDPPGAGTGLYMWEYKLYWNTSWLSLVSREPIIYPGVNDTLLGWETNYTVAANSVGTEAGLMRHWYAVSALSPAPPFTGVMWLCNYTFHVEDQPYEPQLNYTGKFPFHLEAIADEIVTDIITAGDWDIGTFRLLSVPLPPPELGVKPAKVHGVYNEKFNITIEIKYLVTAANMCRWNATLSYNTTMLDAEASWEGPFLDGFGNANYAYIINDTAGTVYTTGFFLTPPATPPNGTGVLATIEFNATWQYTVSSTSLPPITSSLSLYNNNTVNCANLTIKSTVGDPATYTAPYKPQVLDHPIVWPPITGETYHVFTESNSSVSPVPMIFNQSGKSISFNVTGTAGYYGYCNVTIPKVFLSAAPDSWFIKVDGAVITYKRPPTDNGTHVSLYFTYEFLSTRTVEIIGENVIPEFPTAMILPLLFIATLTAAIFGKKVRSGKYKGFSVAE